MQPKFEHIPTQQNSSFISYLRASTQYLFEMHYHPQYELVYIIQGHGKMYAINTAIDYENGDLILFGPNIPHTFASEKGDNRALIVQFPHDILGDKAWSNQDMISVKTLLQGSKNGLLFHNTITDNMKAKLVAINDMIGFDRLIHLLGILHLLSSLHCIKLIGPTRAIKLPMQSESLLKILNFVHCHFTENITLRDASSHVGMSQSGFMKFFKRNFSTNFNDYLINLRVDLACDMLSNTDEKIIDICYQTGFNNLSNFNRQFKKRKQTTPRQYRALFSNGANRNYV